MKLPNKNWVQSLKRWIREPEVIWRSETSKLRTTIEVQQWLPFPLFLITLVWYLAAPSSVAMMSAVTFGGILLCSYLWARTMARGVRGKRALRFAAMQVGDELEEQVGLKNNSPLPVLWAEFIDRSNIPGYTVSSARAAEPGSEVEWRAHTICTRRGVFSLGPWEMRIGEPLGIFHIRQLYLQHQEILVYPPLAALPEHILPHHGALGDHRPLNQPLRAETIASTTVRPYVPGDPLRHIHWRTSARRFDHYVKVFTPEAASNVWLLPDFNASEQVGQGDNDSQETMVTVVASLASALLQQGLAVGLIASAEQETVVLPRQGQNHLWPILQALAPIFAVPDHPLEEVLHRTHGLISGNDLLIVVTPSINPNWVGELRRIARSRGGSGGRAEVILLDPDSFTGEVLAPAAATPADGRPAAGPANGGRPHPTKPPAGVPSHESPPPQAVGEVSRQAQAFFLFLVSQGISAKVLRREEIRLISGFYGEVSRWEFSVGGTGRAIARKAPRQARLLAEANVEQSGSPGWVDLET